MPHIVLTLVVEVGEDATASAVCSDPGTGYSTTGGDCDETNTAVNPGEAEVCNDWLDNDCDGTDNGCAPSGLINLSAADAVILPASEGSNGGSQMGWRVAGGGSCMPPARSRSRRSEAEPCGWADPTTSSTCRPRPT